MKFKDLLKVGVSTLALLAGVVSASEDAVVTGVIVDSAGAPVRGALVQVTNGSRSISRFTDAKGTYRISGLPETTLQVTASRLGFKSQTIDARTPTNGASNFRLEERFDRLQLSDAELLTHLPQNSEVEWLKARCITFHGLTDLERFRGVPEEAWLAMLKSMEFSYGTESLTADDDAYAVKLLMKYFGPDAPVPTAQTVRRTTLSDAALNATYYVIDLRRSGGRSYPHSIAADNQGAAWLSEAGPANRITKWTVSTGQLEEIPMKLPDSAPHTPKIDLKGRVWTALQRAGQQSVIDPKTHKIDYIPLDMKLPHTLARDADGNIWGNGTKIYRIDPETKQIKYWLPISIKEFPKGSWADRGHTPGSPDVIGMGSIKTKDGFSLYAYHAEVDSKGFAWYTQYDTGWLVRLDPRTGEQTIVKSDQVPATRGMDIDADDNIWYTNWGGHGLVKYDPRTGQSKHYRYPTEYAMPYSVFIDKKRGYVWSGDYSGNNLTRLDPRTGEFVEFPLPNPHSYPRFISLDDDGRVWFAEWWNGRAGVLDPGYAPISATARQ